MNQNIETDISMKELLKDRKTDENIKNIIYKNTPKDLKDKDNHFNRLMRFFALEDKPHLEKKEYNECTYKKLEWFNENHFDVINSFWITFACALINSSKYSLYKIKNNFPCIGKDGGMSKKTYALKFLGLHENPSEKLQNFANKTIEENSQLKEFSSLCHSVANFTPCPNGFNIVKNSAEITLNKKVLQSRDFLPLMIDLIEECYALEKTRYNEETRSISFDTIEKWHDYFSGTDKDAGDVRTKYCLEDYYYIYSDPINPDIKHIKGIPFFENQSLEHPLPLKSTEVEQCLDEMVKRIHIRAYRLYHKYSNPSE